MRRFLVVVALVVASGGASTTSSASGTTTTAVTFLVRGNPAARLSVQPSAAVTLLARAAMRGGDRLVIVASRGSKPKTRAVASCLLSPCLGIWHETTGVTVRFRALLKRRSGGALRVVGRSRVVRVTWKAPPPPQPKPVASPGHYEGTTSQNEIFRFDITPDGLGIVNLQTGQINQSCEPHNSLYGGNIGPLTSSGRLAGDGSFTITDSGTTTVNGTTINGSPPATYKYTITGRVAGSVATGTLKRDSGFSYHGVTYICSSGDLTWTATKS